MVFWSCFRGCVLGMSGPIIVARRLLYVVIMNVGGHDAGIVPHIRCKILDISWFLL